MLMKPAVAELSALEAALAYAARGWPVFTLHTIINGTCSCHNPGCTNPGKHPRTLHGFKEATTDKGRIREWWATQSQSNIGLVTGSTSGLIVLDVDAGKGGDDTLLELERKHGSLSKTVEALTGGGGRHLFFAHPGGVVRNSSGRLGPGLDVRGNGGYVVAPPSRHVSGRAYGWDCTAHPDDVPVAPAPAWLLALLKDRPAQQSEAGSSTPIPDGQRNQTLTSLAGSMRRRGMSPAAIEAALLAENTARCRPPLSDEEVRAIATSVARYAPASKTSAPDGVVLREESTSQERAALTFTPLHVLLNEPEEHVPFLVDGRLPRAGISALVSKPKVGKSTMARNLALCVARGRPWLGFSTTQGPVLYLALEEKRGEVRKHFVDMGATDEDPVFVYCAPSPADGVTLLREEAERKQPALIIVDPLLKMIRVKDANDYAAVTAALEPLVTLGRETGAHVLPCIISAKVNAMAATRSSVRRRFSRPWIRP
jgi:Bifunctional DNA primase/polymerase, N-terminal/AAA domain/Primase C terminal 1 (PriCT-1)